MQRNGIAGRIARLWRIIMTFPVSKVAVAVALASLTLVTFAQPCASFAQTNSSASTQPKGNPAPSGVMGSIISVASALGIRTITGEPFSAEEESERSQVLADGTHVSQTTKVHNYRDSEGRTRSEGVPAQLQEGEPFPTIVNISDPVAGVRYMLEMRRQVARRYPIPAPGDNRPRVEPTDSTNQPPPTRVRHAPVQTTTSQTTPDSADQPVRRRVSHVSLGTQTIEGIETKGLQTTITIPVGAEGNDRPIEIVCENWESPQLKLMMLTKCTDPLHGDHTTRVVSIDRSEPDPSLFQVPPDFKIEDQQTRSAPETTTTTER
jgi:hypothetical protein